MFSRSGDMRLLTKTEQRQQSPRAVTVGVLVDDPLARTAAELLCLAGIVEEVPNRGRRLVGIRDDEELAAGLEPLLDPVVGVRDDRGARRSELERAAGGRREDARVRAPRDAQVDARRRDRLREEIEGDVASEASVARVPEEVPAAEREVCVGQSAGRLADHRRDPLAAELVS